MVGGFWTPHISYSDNHKIYVFCLPASPTWCTTITKHVIVHMQRMTSHWITLDLHCDVIIEFSFVSTDDSVARFLMRIWPIRNNCRKVHFFDFLCLARISSKSIYIDISRYIASLTWQYHEQKLANNASTTIICCITVKWINNNIKLFLTD